MSYSKSDQFLNWLQGYLEAIQGEPTLKHIATISDKLEKVLSERVELVPPPYPVYRGDPLIKPPYVSECKTDAPF